jgi:hypothetical protein
MKKIPLTQGKFAIVDDDVFGRINCHNWCLEKVKGKEYAQRKIGRVKTVKMHREIMCVLPGLEIDHINGDGLDNRKVNLRVCTHAENARNRGPNKKSQSRYKGVHFFKGKWVALITYKKQRFYLGRFRTEEEAAESYKKKAEELYGKVDFKLKC